MPGVLGGGCEQDIVAREVSVHEVQRVQVGQRRRNLRRKGYEAKQGAQLNMLYRRLGPACGGACALPSGGPRGRSKRTFLP